MVYEFLLILINQDKLGISKKGTLIIQLNVKNYNEYTNEQIILHDFSRNNFIQQSQQTTPKSHRENLSKKIKSHREKKYITNANMHQYLLNVFFMIIY